MAVTTTFEQVNSAANYKVRVRKNASDEQTQVIAIEGVSDFATGQVSITTSATLIAAVRSTRRSITITNLGTTDVYIGVSGVTSSTGVLLLGVKGSSLTIETTQAVYAITASGTQSISYMEEFD